jgi:methylisocitrate lyase
MIKVNRGVDGPTQAIQGEGAKTPMIPAKELEEMGFSVVVYPASALYAAAWAVKGVMEELMKKGTTKGFLDNMFKFHEFNKLMGLKKFMETESLYLSDLIK